MKRSHHIIKAILAASISLCATSAAIAQTPLNIIVPYAPGGGADIAARALGEGLGAKIGRTIVVQNKTGAGGRIALQALKSLPRGTEGVVIGYTGILTNSILFQDKSSYDFKSDFIPVAQLGRVPLGLITKGGKYENLTDYITKHPEKTLTFANYGPGSLSHLVGLGFADKIGFKAEPIAYQGMAVMYNDLMGEQLDAIIDTIGDYAERHKAGSLRVLATFGKERTHFTPDAPTLAEQGFQNLEGGDIWLGMLAGKHADPRLLTDLQEALREMLKDEQIREKLKPLIEIDYKNSEEFKQIIDKDYEHWEPVIKKLGINNN